MIFAALAARYTFLRRHVARDARVESIPHILRASRVNSATRARAATSAPARPHIVRTHSARVSRKFCDARVPRIPHVPFAAYGLQRAVSFQLHFPVANRMQRAHSPDLDDDDSSNQDPQQATAAAVVAHAVQPVIQPDGTARGFYDRVTYTPDWVRDHLLLSAEATGLSHAEVLDWFHRKRSNACLAERRWVLRERAANDKHVAALKTVYAPMPVPADAPRRQPCVYKRPNKPYDYAVMPDPSPLAAPPARPDPTSAAEARARPVIAAATIPPPPSPSLSPVRPLSPASPLTLNDFDTLADRAATQAQLSALSRQDAIAVEELVRTARASDGARSAADVGGLDAHRVARPMRQPMYLVTPEPAASGVASAAGAVVDDLDGGDWEAWPGNPAPSPTPPPVPRTRAAPVAAANDDEEWPGLSDLIGGYSHERMPGGGPVRNGRRGRPTPPPKPKRVRKSRARRGIPTNDEKKEFRPVLPIRYVLWPGSSAAQYDDMARRSEPLGTGTACITCMMFTPSMVMIPCFHIGLCAGCTALHMRALTEDGKIRCPMCNKPVSMALQVFHQGTPNNGAPAPSSQ